MLEIENYERKPLEVEVVRVTETNMDAVAEWCKGTVDKDDNGRSFVRVWVFKPKTDKHSMAFPGNYILRSHNGYKIYNEFAFKNAFQKIAKPEFTSDDLPVMNDCVS